LPRPAGVAERARQEVRVMYQSIASITSEDFSGTFLSPLVRFGVEVKRIRLGLNLTQKHLGHSTGYSESYVCQVESGKLIPSERFATGCDDAFQTDGLFRGLLQQIEEGDHPVQFVPYVQLEQQAWNILDFSTMLVKGLLQTWEYAEAVFRAGHPSASDEMIRSKVAARMSRQQILKQDRPPMLWSVLHESCLRSNVGGPHVMACQLEYLMQVGSLPGVDIQVMPFVKGAVAVLYSEDPQGGRLCRRMATVKSAMQKYDRIRAHALPPDDSMTFIEMVHEEYVR
jgi:transcriptional regulator with XRE-family HTH domain